MIKRLFSLLLIVLSTNAFAQKSQINIYCWGNYIPKEILRKFEAETGIHVNLSEYDSNSVLYIKLKTVPKSYYDVIFPSSSYVTRMKNEHLIRKLDHSKLPNIKNINNALLQHSVDPMMDYSIPYFWGTTGIIVNDKYHNPKNITSWQALWLPKYKNQLLILDDMQEVFSMAFSVLGYPLNDTDPDHIKQAYELLRKLLPNIKLFRTDAAQEAFIGEDATIGMGWNGDMFRSMRHNPHIKFIFPKNPLTFWIDCTAIPINSPNPEGAYKFVNFLMRPDIAAEIAIREGYSSPNSAAIKLMPKTMRESKTLNPPESVINRMVIQKDLGKARLIYGKYWERLKLGL